MPSDLAAHLKTEFNVAATPVIAAEQRAICRRWLEKFCPNVKRKTRRWVYHGFRWHAYSFNHELAETGDRAFEQYQSQSIEPFYIFDERKDLLFACSALHWPDLRGLVADVYIFPQTMAWTFVTTHEMSLGLGPYFARPPIV